MIGWYGDMRINDEYYRVRGKENDLLVSLNAIQCKIKVPKSQLNKAGNYKFRNSDDILEAVKPYLESFKLSLLLSDNVVNIGGFNYVESIATLVDSTGSYIEAVGYAREMIEPKGILTNPMLTGSASSYARKYALNGLFALDDAKDPDDNIPVEEPSKEEPKPEKSYPKPSPKQLKIIRENIEEPALSAVVGSFGFQSLEEIDKDTASAIVKKIFNGEI